MIKKRDERTQIDGRWALPEAQKETEEVLSLMEMSNEERDELLVSQNAGVLSLCKNNVPYSFPVSYEYGPEETLIVLMLGYAPGSRKREWIEDGGAATFVVHEMKENAEARSVVVEGRLSEVKREDEERAYEVLSGAKFTSMHESGVPIEETDYALHELEVENVHGRKFEHDALDGR
ncbi:MAG: pyridoxamine 5'-phosphate oxidase family protein [Halobacteriales archaeon]